MIGCYKAVSRRSGLVSDRKDESGCFKLRGATRTSIPKDKQPSVFETSRLASRRESQKRRRDEAESSLESSSRLGLKGRKEYAPYEGPRKVPVIVDRATLKAATRFLANYADDYGGIGHVIGQLAKAELSRLGYLAEKSPLENVETAYGKRLREDAEYARKTEIFNIRDSWSTLTDKSKRFWMERFPELHDLALPSPEQTSTK